ncbi:MAG TPA: RNA ligase family protein [Kofleriaceae bacterium]|nr:RNA ligase family protein [Kofleriaceae bacterium]
MRFRMFPKIPTHRAAPPRAVGGPWVALEKLHGGQLVVGVVGDAVHFGKRKAWLAPDEPFFGWQLLAAELGAAARAIARELGAAQTVLYGELIGGGYPHPEVSPVPGLSPVQTGIWYTPGLAWVAFDALVAASDDDDGELLAFRELEELAAAAAVRTAPRLLRGTRAEVEHVPIEFPTHVPAWLGLPPLPRNLAEGVVLRPDARAAPADRPVIKRKLADFDDERFREAEAWDPGHLGEADLTAWLDRLVVPARLASARSKVGTDPSAIADEVALDVAIDLGLAFPGAWIRLPAEAQERILARARERARDLCAAART